MEWILLLLIILISHIIQGITGFAGTMLAIPAASMVIGFEEARGMMSLITIASAFVIVIVSYKSIN